MEATTQYSLPEENGQGLLRYLNLDMPLHNVYDFIELSRNGINKRNLLFLAKKIDFDLKELSKVLHISERTLQRYASSKILSLEVSERAIQLARLYCKGEEVFGDLNLFKKWMLYPSQALGMKMPKELLDTTFGFQLLNDELIKIEYGVFS
ncbi:type II RES/Xre toxin-antitoxin system antitoxin [Pseudofulvibacter geojedonensis]|uniref:Antitoxin Xre-like helix-turn-helix domain-containing protein n=1 Tax=Pseudofulvibacter geojedonensis TaxID=1123758 RepID=A0ABW3HZG9_9FLAO